MRHLHTLNNRLAILTTTLAETSATRLPNTPATAKAFPLTAELLHLHTVPTVVLTPSIVQLMAIIPVPAITDLR